MTAHWIFPTFPTNYEICKKYRVFGVDERYEVTATQLIKPFDLVFFYITKEQIFKGPWIVKGRGRYNPNHPAVDEWYPKRKYTYLIPIDLMETERVCPLERVFNKLLFITNRKKGKGGFSDHFQFSIISIREEDFNLILENSIHNHETSPFRRRGSKNY